ncbi:MAG: transaldolase family protein [Steroidobacteraceae bacterium]
MHHQLRLRASCGQHVWLDELSRGLIESGELDRWIARGVSGITTNPTLFERALLERHDLAADVRCLAAAGLEPAQIHESLALEDVREAADRLRGAFDASDGATGFVSIGIDPEDAVDQERAISAGLRLSRRANRPNVMIKMPATGPVLEAVPALLARSVPLSLTLILGESQHAAAWDAWQRGVERLDGGAPATPVALSVAVNPIDEGIDAALGDVAGLQDWSGAWCLHGCGALAVARRIYERHAERQRQCAAQSGGTGGAAPRLVWASTGVGGAGDDPLRYARPADSRDDAVPAARHARDAAHRRGRRRRAPQPGRRRGGILLRSRASTSTSIALRRRWRPMACSATWRPHTASAPASRRSSPETRKDLRARRAPRAAVRDVGQPADSRPQLR